MHGHGCCIKADVPTAILCQPNFAVLYLSLTSFSLQLPNYFYDLAQPRCPYWMPPSEQSAGRIDREFPTQPCHVVLDEFRSISWNAEAEVFVDADLCGSNCIMYFSKIHIFRAASGQAMT